jgi:hypothetical protein
MPTASMPSPVPSLPLAPAEERWLPSSALASACSAWPIPTMRPRPSPASASPSVASARSARKVTATGKTARRSARRANASRRRREPRVRPSRVVPARTGSVSTCRPMRPTAGRWATAVARPRSARPAPAFPAARVRPARPSCALTAAFLLCAALIQGQVWTASVAVAPKATSCASRLSTPLAAPSHPAPAARAAERARSVSQSALRAAREGRHKRAWFAALFPPPEARGGTVLVQMIPIRAT